MARAQAILEAIRRAVEPHRAFLDQAPGLRSVRVDVKFKVETGEVRTVIVSPEIENVGRC